MSTSDNNTLPDATQEESVIDDVQEEQNVPQYERHEPSFFAMVPKMAQMDLTPYELALYCNLKQTASDGGSVTKSNRTLAFETRMSVAQVKRARKSLETKGYIRVEHRVNEHGVQNQTNVITLRDVWALNHHRFKTQKEFMTGVGPPEPGVGLSEPGGGSTRTPSNNHKSKNQKKKKDSSSTKVPDPIYNAVNEHCFKGSGGGYLLGPLTSWLKGEAEYVTANRQKNPVRRIGPQSIEDIAAFAADYAKKRKSTGESLTMPRNVIPFILAYLDWLDARRPVAPAAPIDYSAYDATLDAAAFEVG